MPKLKTNRGAAKRFRAQAHGSKRKQSHRSHILTTKSPKRKRQLRRPAVVGPTDAPRLVPLLPYH